MGLRVVFCHWAIKDLGWKIWSLPIMDSYAYWFTFYFSSPLRCLVGISYFPCPKQTLISLFLIALTPTPLKVFLILVSTPFFPLFSPKPLESFSILFFLVQSTRNSSPIQNLATSHISSATILGSCPDYYCSHITDCLLPFSPPYSLS